MKNVRTGRADFNAPEDGADEDHGVTLRAFQSKRCMPVVPLQARQNTQQLNKESR